MTNNDADIQKRLEVYNWESVLGLPNRQCKEAKFLMIDNSENPNVLANETILSQAKEILDRLIAAVDILVDNDPKSDNYNINNVLAEFDDILLEEGNSSFSDVHMIHCHCDSAESIPNLEEECIGQNEEDAEYEHESFDYEMMDMDEDSLAFQRQARNVTFDDMVRGLLSLPPAPDAQRIINPISEEESDNDAEVIVDEPLLSEEGGDGEEVVEEIEFIERMMLYFRETDLFLEEENQGSGDHHLDPPLD
ncbi:hypothetical protein HNY73_000255 [Argiope bruennichi]|uniref:Uncharacterized protein n=1 Tax=Argiope bruennichi TaxID=94029 RepID=A0A8T0FYM0_ARGBR|nr:hypothetical protein HNY73_000255 [Argiope bruennichi]